MSWHILDYLAGTDRTKYYRDLTFAVQSWLAVAMENSLFGSQSNPWILARWADTYWTAWLVFCSEEKSAAFFRMLLWTEDPEPFFVTFPVYKTCIKRALTCHTVYLYGLDPYPHKAWGKCEMNVHLFTSTYSSKERSLFICHGGGVGSPHSKITICVSLT